MLKKILSHHNNDNTSKNELPLNDLTKKLFESQSFGLAELYEKMNKSISINKIIEDSKSFKKNSEKKVSEDLQQIRIKSVSLYK